jgi:hypothetical protein
MIKLKVILITAFAFCIAVYALWSCNAVQANTDDLSSSAQLAERDSSVSQLASVKARLNVIDSVMQLSTSVLLKPEASSEEAMAQQILLGDATMQQFCKGENNSKLLVEIFYCAKALRSDTANCNTCYKIDVYNFTLNKSLSAIVDIATKAVSNISIIEQSAPDVPEHLKKIAVDIAINSKLVQKELGDVPELKDAQMAYTKTALNNSKCQRSLHLCVAPTFTKGAKALWSIVDLTDLNLVGTRWTYIGDQAPVQISERKIQNDVLSNCYCEKANAVNQSGWSFNYMLTSSDGLKIEKLNFKNKAILKSAKLVDWHVSYSNSDGFGYSDGAGCPQFSLSAVTAWDKPTISKLVINGQEQGFVLEQVFKSDGWPANCNYNYVQRFEFYNDGRFRCSAASLGRGCGSDGTYRPVFRIAFEGANTFSEFSDGQFATWNTEKWSLQKETSAYDAQGNFYKISGQVNYLIEPSRGQFNDKGRGDNAFVYVSKYKNTEGESDLVTIGPCCNIDYKQGPEKFIEPNAEQINNTDIVLWYVPQMKNDNEAGKEYCWAKASVVNGKYTTTAYPCFAGPMFNPINSN